MKYTFKAHMGASSWTVTAGNVTIDMNKLDKAAQRKVIFELVKHVRIMRDGAK